MKSGFLHSRCFAGLLMPAWPLHSSASKYTVCTQVAKGCAYAAAAAPGGYPNLFRIILEDITTTGVAIDALTAGVSELHMILPPGSPVDTAYPSINMLEDMPKVELVKRHWIFYNAAPVDICRHQSIKDCVCKNVSMGVFLTDEEGPTPTRKPDAEVRVSGRWFCAAVLFEIV
jgi:hypothetical protein